MSTIPTTWRSTRVCAGFLAAAAIVTVSSWFVPELTAVFALYPSRVLGAGWIWQLVTYSLIHLGIVHLAVQLLSQ